MFNFTSLLGAQSTSPASQSLIELEGGIKILVDVGWDESFDVALLKELEKQVPTLSLVLLTHATTSHLAAFAYCCKYFPLFTSVPIYATAPVISLGRALLQDLYSSTPLAASVIPNGSLYEGASYSSRTSSNILLQRPTTEEIASYFALVNPLKYSQPHEPAASPFSPPLNGLTITAYSAGHSLGGTIWHIQHGLESIVYAVDWNQAKESALQGAAWLGTGGGEVIESLRRPTALVCSSRASQRVVLPGGRDRRDDQMIKLLRETIAKGGTVLIPSDSCARVLEISYFLEAAWNREQDNGRKPDSLRNANLYLASASSGLTMRYARSMLEWMDEDVVREFESAAQLGGQSKQQAATNERVLPKAPFDFQFLRMIERPKQLNRVLSQSGPKVIIATDLSMEWGFSRRLFETIAADDRNLLILPEPIVQTAAGQENIGYTLWNMWSGKSSAGFQTLPEESLTRVVATDGSPITYNVAHTENLEGNELLIYQQYLARERQRQRAFNPDKSTSLETGGDMIDDRSSSSSEESEESDGEHQGKVLNVSTALTSRHKLGLTDAELGIDILIRRKGHYDYDVRSKRGRERMYPVLPSKRNPRNDDFGDVIRPEDYLRAEERENMEGQDTAGAKTDKELVLGQKRRWNEVATQLTVHGRAGTNGTKRRKSDDEGLFSDPSQMGTDGAAVNGSGIKDLSDSDDEMEETDSGPMKAVFATKSLRLHLRIAHVDFSGLHDKRSMQMLIPMIRPRKLVLVGGDQSETLALAAECKKLLSIGTMISADTAAEVLTPLIGQTLDASVDTNAWNVKLSFSLRKQLHWQNVGGLGVVPLTSHLSAAPSAGEQEVDSRAKRVKSGEVDVGQTPEPPDTNGSIETVPLLDIVPANKAAATRIVARPFHVGDLRLSDLRKMMQSQGYAAEFRGEGTLLVNGMVAVRKSAVGKVEVETVIGIPGFSVIDPTFDDVRRRIYEGLLAVMSGS